jgi:hypothetical protein
MNQQLITTTGENNMSLIASVTDRKALQSLLPVEKKIIEAALQPKINTQPPIDVVTTLITIITTAYTRAGFKMPEDSGATLALYADEFYTSLLERYPNVTIAEIREAMKDGVYGEAGEFTGLNPKTFMQFIKHYLFTETRKEARKQFESMRLRLAEQAKMTPQQKEEDDKEYCNYLYEQFLQNVLMVDYIPTFAYDFLEAQGILKLSLDAKKSISERAKAYFLRLKTSKKYKGNTRSIGDELTAYVQSRDEEITIKNMSKQFAVSFFFEALKTDGTKQVFPITKKLKG